MDGHQNLVLIPEFMRVHNDDVLGRSSVDPSCWISIRVTLFYFIKLSLDSQLYHEVVQIDTVLLYKT
jgi:hypothetical protein